jgi:hypothetical protein
MIRCAFKLGLSPRLAAVHGSNWPRPPTHLCPVSVTLNQRFNPKAPLVRGTLRASNALAFDKHIKF